MDKSAYFIFFNYVVSQEFRPKIINKCTKKTTGIGTHTIL